MSEQKTNSEYQPDFKLRQFEINYHPDLSNGVAGLQQKAILWTLLQKMDWKTNTLQRTQKAFLNDLPPSIPLSTFQKRLKELKSKGFIRIIGNVNSEGQRVQSKYILQRPRLSEVKSTSQINKNYPHAKKLKDKIDNEARKLEELANEAKKAQKEKEKAHEKKKEEYNELVEILSKAEKEGLEKGLSAIEFQKLSKVKPIRSFLHSKHEIIEFNEGIYKLIALDQPASNPSIQMDQNQPNPNQSTSNQPTSTPLELSDLLQETLPTKILKELTKGIPINRYNELKSKHDHLEKAVQKGVIQVADNIYKLPSQPASKIPF